MTKQRQIDIVALVVLFGATIALFWNAHAFSLTSDEKVYTPAGLRYMLVGDKILNDEHPPANKLLAGLAVLPLRPSIDAGMAEAPDNQWGFGDAVWFRSGASFDALLFVSRLPFVLLTITMFGSVYWFFRQRYNEWYGLGALLPLALNPNILAHGAFNTNDVLLVVATWFVILASVNLIDRPTRTTYLYWAVAIAFLALTKFSGVLLLPFAVLIPSFMLFRKNNLPWQKTAIAIIGSAVVAASIVWATYAYIERTTLTNTNPVTVTVLNHSYTFVHRSSRLLFVPLGRYIEGATAVQNHNTIGHLSYLNGETSQTGFRSYFLYTLWYKTPTVLLVLFALGLWVSCKKRDVLALSCAIAGVAFLVASSMSSIHIGIRHILPVFLLFAPAVGVLLHHVQRFRPRFSSAVLAIALLLICLDLLKGGGIGIGYFSAITGGNTQGYRHVADSNIDWGQELTVVADYVKTHNITDVAYGFMQGEDPAIRRFSYVSFENQTCASLATHSTVIATTNSIVGVHGNFPCFRPLVDAGRATQIGQSTYVFHGADLIP